MNNAGEIVERYFTALYAGDLETARQYLADNVSFRGPAASFSGADTYLKATQHAVRALKRVDKRKVFVDGSDVCILFDLHIDGRRIRHVGAFDCVPEDVVEGVHWREVLLAEVHRH